VAQCPRRKNLGDRCGVGYEAWFPNVRIRTEIFLDLGIRRGMKYQRRAITHARSWQHSPAAPQAAAALENDPGTSPRRQSVPRRGPHCGTGAMQADVPTKMTSAAAWAQAKDCADMASTTVDLGRRTMLLHLRDSWIQIANELALVETGLPQERPLHSGVADQ
jgi:hypothetical protein